MGGIDWVRRIFASYNHPAPGKKQPGRDDDKEEEIEELIAIDII